MSLEERLFERLQQYV